MTRQVPIRRAYLMPGMYVPAKSFADAEIILAGVPADVSSTAAAFRYCDVAHTIPPSHATRVTHNWSDLQ